MTSTTALATRLQRLEDREAIKALIARYGLVMDDRDMQGMPVPLLSTHGTIPGSAFVRGSDTHARLRGGHGRRYS